MDIMSTQQIMKDFGFCADKDLPAWTNAKIELVGTTSKDYFDRINKMAYHDLSTAITPPENIGKLLGQGLKFCIQSRRPDKASLTEGMARMRRDVRLKYIFTEADEDLIDTEYDYNPKLYINSKLNPPPANKITETRLMNFHLALKSSRKALTERTKPATNITPTVDRLLSSVMCNKWLIILSTDKNLGPDVMERHLYIQSMLTEHLLDSKTYRQLDNQDTNNIRDKFREDV